MTMWALGKGLWETETLNLRSEGSERAAGRSASLSMSGMVNPDRQPVLRKNLLSENGSWGSGAAELELSGQDSDRAPTGIFPESPRSACLGYFRQSPSFRERR